MSSGSLAPEYATDTVGLILHLERRPMGAQAQAVFTAAEAGQTVIHVPAMVLAEILYLSEKGRISISLADVAQHLQTFPSYRESAMNQAIIEAAAQITDIRELHDRLIAATARWLNVALLTNDTVLQSSSFVKTLW